MSPIDLLGHGNTIRAPSLQHPATRPGAEKAIAMQPASTARPTAPIETTQAILHPEAGTRTAMNTHPWPPAHETGKADLPAPPMTAVLLHELRLQQELADLQATKERDSAA